MTDLPSLITTIEDAKEGSREIDAQLMTLLFGEPVPIGNIGDPQVLHWHDGGVYMSVPFAFTGSLDDARLLVPDGWYAIMDTRGEADLRHPEEPYRREVHAHPSVIISLVIAALKARSHRK